MQRRIYHSQNDEEHIINMYFLIDKKQLSGTFLDLGANDGMTLSNTHGLARQRWRGHCVEPCPTPFEKLRQLYYRRLDIQISNIAIGVENGEAEILRSDSHLKNGDTDLLSTLKQGETIRWGETQIFTPEIVNVLDFKTFMKTSNLKTFDFISIDIEGLDYDVLIQMDLKELGCKMLCIESNSIDDQKYIDYCAKFGMKLHHKNYENLIFTV